MKKTILIVLQILVFIYSTGCEATLYTPPYVSGKQTGMAFLINENNNVNLLKNEVIYEIEEDYPNYTNVSSTYILENTSNKPQEIEMVLPIEESGFNVFYGYENYVKSVTVNDTEQPINIIPSSLESVFNDYTYRDVYDNFINAENNSTFTEDILMTEIKIDISKVTKKSNLNSSDYKNLAINLDNVEYDLAIIGNTGYMYGGCANYRLYTNKDYEYLSLFLFGKNIDVDQITYSFFDDNDDSFKDKGYEDQISITYGEISLRGVMEKIVTEYSVIFSRIYSDDQNIVNDIKYVTTQGQMDFLLNYINESMVENETKVIEAYIAASYFYKRSYEFIDTTISLGPNEIVEVEYNFIVIPSKNHTYSPYIDIVNYVVTCDTNWNSIGEVSVIIITDKYLLETNCSYEATNVNGQYQYNFEVNLEEQEDFKAILSSSENPEVDYDYKDTGYDIP